MDVLKIKADLLNMSVDARQMGNRYIGLSVLARELGEETLGRLFESGGDDDPDVQVALQHARVCLAGLDRAMALFGEELVARAQAIQRDKQGGSPPPTGSN